MEKIYIYGIAVSLVVLLSPLFFIGGTLLSPSKNLEECNVLMDGGKDSIGIVFLSTKEQAKKFSKGLFEIEPFNSIKDDFSVYYINYKPKCELYKGKAILCSSKENLKTASSCPNDYTIAVSDEYSKNIRSSSFRGVISLNAKHPYQTVAHELGHAISNLADEYVPAILPKGSPNCVKTCKAFDRKNDGCFKGCSKFDYFRSVDNGLMRTLKTKNFGNFNKIILKEDIKKDYESGSVSGILGFAVKDSDFNIDCSDEMYYLVEINDNRTIENIEVEVGCSSELGKGEFEASLLKENKEIFSKKFSQTIFSDVEENGKLTGGSDNYTGLSYIKVPYPKSGADKLVVSSDEGIISELNLGGVDSLPCEL